MKLGSSTIRRIGIGAVAVLGGYLGHLSLTQAPDGPEPAIYPLLEPVGDWATWAEAPAYSLNVTRGQVFDITDYGAIPDDQIPDMDEIRAAFDAAEAWQTANAGALVTIYAPAGEYIIWSEGPDTEAERVIFPLHFDNLVFEGDGPTETIFNVRGWGGQDPAGLMLNRGFMFSTLFTPGPLDGITLRGFRATCNTLPNQYAGQWYGDQALTGWDIQNKFLAIFSSYNVTNIRVEKVEADGWRGEIMYAGGGPELLDFFITDCIIRGCNASAVSMGGNVVVDNCEIYDVYNGTECLAFDGQGLTVRNSTIEPNRDYAYGKFGVAYLGWDAAQLTVEDNELGSTTDGAIFLSECASNVTIQRNTFTDVRALYMIFLNQYNDANPDPVDWATWNDAEENRWENILFDDNTLIATTSNPADAILLTNNAGSGLNWTFSNNTLTGTGGHYYQNFIRTVGGATAPYVVSGNTLGDPTNPVYVPSDATRPSSWTTNTIGATYADGGHVLSYLSDADPTPLTIEPGWPRLNITELGSETMSRIVEIDSAKLALYPTGFPLRIIRSLYNTAISVAEIQPDASWNTLTRGYMLAPGGELNLVKNAGGKFELVSYTANTVNLRTLTESATGRRSSADIALFGQLSVTLAPTVAHTYSTFSGVAIGETVTLNLNGNVTLEHNAGVIEMSTGVDYVSAGTVALSATRAADGTLEVTIP